MLEMKPRLNQPHDGIGQVKLIGLIIGALLFNGSAQAESFGLGYNEGRHPTPKVAPRPAEPPTPPTPLDWCGQMFQLLGNHYTDPYLKQAALEKMRNRGCLK